MIPPAFSISPPTVPVVAKLEELTLKVSPRARKSANHINGQVVGSVASYTDVHAMTWFFGGGHETRNALHGRISKYLHGFEDTDTRKAQ
jgi:hypothetical protein